MGLQKSISFEGMINFDSFVSSLLSMNVETFKKADLLYTQRLAISKSGVNQVNVFEISFNRAPKLSI